MKNSRFKSLLKNSDVISVRCLQWGDTGKGKLVHMLSDWADIIVRPSGGNNAGHTVFLGDKAKVFHALPSAISQDKYGKINVLGSNMVLDPRALCEEIESLNSEGFSCDNMQISQEAKLILPTQILEDRLKEFNFKNSKIGTTGKGIGPAYADHVSRIGLTFNDLLNPDVFSQKLKKHLESKLPFFSYFDLFLLEDLFNAVDLDSGLYFDPKNIFNFETIFNSYLNYGEKLSSMIKDTESLVKENLHKKKILLEGAQGLLLSIDYGTYPFVTSSDPSLEGMVKGAGLALSDVDMDIGIIKGFMQTRVGNGPFPTEMGAKHSQVFCANNTREEEEKAYPGNLSINSKNEFLQGIALRKIAGEYGATTKRLRRVGWLDLVLLRKALSSGAKNTYLALTKLDVLSGVDVIKVCVGYSYQGPDYYYGEKVFKSGDIIHSDIPMYSEFLDNCTPIYTDFKGWKEDISKINSYTDLPQQLKLIIAFIENYLNGNNETILVSVGPKADETIFL